jgi:hypothetical protein
MIKLTIELVPSTSWFNNLRSQLANPNDWDKIRKLTYQLANYTCQICGGRGNKHPVECHEIFVYDDVNLVQTFERCVALCPQCHSVKHIGFAITQNRHVGAIQHLMLVNEWSRTQTIRYIEECFVEYHRRSRHHWKVDLSNVVRFYNTPLKDRSTTNDRASG